jgi:hypothetical protein
MNNDLISREAAIAYIDVGHLRNPTEICFSELDVVRMLDRMPAVDAEYVRHSAWECEGDGYFFCKGCKKYIVVIGGDANLNFCPNCGAKTDGGAE